MEDKRNSSSGGRAEGMVERPQGHTFGDPLPSRGWVPCLQHMSLGGSTAYANQNTGYLALQPRTVDSGGQPQAWPANRGIEVCSWLLCSEIPSFIPHLFPHPQSRDSDCLSSHLSQDFLNHNPCTDRPCMERPGMGKSASHTPISISNSLPSMSSSAWHVGLTRWHLPRAH